MFSMLYKLFLAVLAASAMFANGPVAPVNSFAMDLQPCKENYRSQWIPPTGKDSKLHCVSNTPDRETGFYWGPPLNSDNCRSCV